MRFCCRIFASHLRQSAIESEIVKFIQKETIRISYNNMIIFMRVTKKEEKTS